MDFENFPFNFTFLLVGKKKNFLEYFSLSLNYSTNQKPIFSSVKLSSANMQTIDVIAVYSVAIVAFKENNSFFEADLRKT